MAEVLVTGCSSGIGLLTAAAFAGAGDHVIAGVREPAAATELRARIRTHSLPIDVVALDVTDSYSIDRFVAHALETRSGIDVIVNNAGVAFVAAIEDSDDQRIHELMATNFYGPLRLIRTVLPHLRARGHGHIINLSSRAHSGAAFTGVYGASKAALEALSVSLAHEVAPFGIHVTVVEPASFHTAIDHKFAAGLRPSAVYPDRAEAVVDARNRAASQHTELVADAIVRAAHSHPPPARIQVRDGPGGAPPAAYS